MQGTRQAHAHGLAYTAEDDKAIEDYHSKLIGEHTLAPSQAQGTAHVSHHFGIRCSSDVEGTSSLERVQWSQRSKRPLTECIRRPKTHRSRYVGRIIAEMWKICAC
ncbi:hypothetical protein PAXRUDRAFT_793898 [Paxillus rubicundulus Ve08.2h10]|uniref:Uncharacterized protein n=1 Tax=Paxillus rubicundulus Ve08.2h10 TaxID=930991 RepID=A0A0D0ECC0_9AGAM|nr:hypothetical protein PAXRUDRAFT_793898 [Paxillus rubicundulus Ve08.2h10]